MSMSKQQLLQKVRAAAHFHHTVSCHISLTQAHLQPSKQLKSLLRQ